jgi:hypothetical protein
LECQAAASSISSCKLQPLACFSAFIRNERMSEKFPVLKEALKPLNMSHLCVKRQKTCREGLHFDRLNHGERFGWFGIGRICIFFSINCLRLNRGSS